MKNLTLKNSIEILRTYISKVLFLNINFVKKGWCIGDVAKEFRRKGNKDGYRFETYANLEIDIQIDESNIINISDLSNTLKNLEEMTGWKCWGFTASRENKNSLTLHFDNYYYLKPKE